MQLRSVRLDVSQGCDLRFELGLFTGVEHLLQFGSATINQNCFERFC